jgi:hypothetical protein
VGKPCRSPRYLAGKVALRVAARLHHKHYYGLDYPATSNPAPRWGHGVPSHDVLEEIISGGYEEYRASLELIARYRDDLLRIPPLGRPESLEPRWRNQWLPPLDVASLYTFIRERKPTRYVEIGSGVSTTVAARARRDGRLTTRITSIDPQPRHRIDVLCDEVVRHPFEDVDPEVLASIPPDSILLLDGSHRVFMNSDVTAFFLDVLPRLPEGVLVATHDIMLPEDYPPAWADWYLSEQYMMAAYLLGGAARMELVLACNYASSVPELVEILGPLWEGPTMRDVEPHGSLFWFRVAGGALRASARSGPARSARVTD